MSEQSFKVRVIGIKPLLTHNPISMTGANPPPGKKPPIPPPEEEADAGAYHLKNGGYGIPGVAFRSAIVTASTAFKPGRGRGTLKGAIAHIQVEPEIVPLETPDGDLIKTYTVDTRRAVIQKAGILRSRPRFDEWAATIEIIYDPELIGEEQIIAVLADAGNRIGVGDYRPDPSKGKTGGWFGRFRVE